MNKMCQFLDLHYAFTRLAFSLLKGNQTLVKQHISDVWIFEDIYLLIKNWYETDLLEFRYLKKNIIELICHQLYDRTCYITSIIIYLLLSFVITAAGNKIDCQSLNFLTITVL